MNTGEIVTIVSQLLLTLFTAIYVYLTWRLVLETRNVRKEQMEPNISIYTQQDYHNIDLIIKNIGIGGAYDIEFENIDPEFKNMLGTSISELIPIKKGLKYLASNKELKILLTIFGKIGEYRDKNYIIVVHYKDRFGESYEKRFPIDFSGFLHPMHIPKPEIVSISENIEKISLAITKIAEIYHTMTYLESVKENEKIAEEIDKEMSKETDKEMSKETDKENIDIEIAKDTDKEGITKDCV